MRKKGSKLLQGAAGVSLMEMLFSLVIFSVIVFPLMMVPMRAYDQSEQSKNTSLISYELGNLFDQMYYDVNQSYRFFPLDTIIATNTAAKVVANYNTSQQFFIAYWDNASKTEKRIGYFLNNTGNKNAANQNIWQLTRTIIPSGNTLSQYQTNAGPSIWQTLAQIINNTQFYVLGTDGNPPVFVYCQGNTCNNTIGPKNADGVSLQSSAGAGLQFTYKNSSVTFQQPIYLKLASLKDYNYRQHAVDQILPFATAVEQWGVAQDWMVEQTIPLSTTTYANNNLIYPASAVQAPVNTQTLATANAQPLTINGMHYNVNTGELLAISSSLTLVPASERGFYIFKFRPGVPGYSPYTLAPSTGTTYEYNFPVVIHQTDTSISTYFDPTTGSTTPWTLNQFLGVTQDNADNIYVLARYLNGTTTTGYWVLKFSPSGGYISSFSLGSDVSTAYGITYAPGTPEDVLVLLETGATTGSQYVIRAYNRSSTTQIPTQVVYDNQSASLTGLNMPLVADSTNTTPNWSNVNGFTYDPLHNRYLVSFQSAPGASAEILSMDASLNTKGYDGTPASLAVVVSNILNPSMKNNLLGAGTSTEAMSALAFDPINNQAYLATNYSTTQGNYYYYYRIIPNVRLNRVREQ